MNASASKRARVDGRIAVLLIDELVITLDAMMHTITLSQPEVRAVIEEHHVD
jgi:hypothetical protein